MVGTGLLIVNITVFDTGPVEFLTVTFAVPPTATLAAGTIAVSCVEEIKVVVSAAPFHCTFEVLSKPLPFTVRVNCGDPAKHEFGLIELMLVPPTRCRPQQIQPEIAGPFSLVNSDDQGRGCRPARVRVCAD